MKKLIPWLKVSVAVVLIVIIVRGVDFDQFRQKLVGRGGDFSLYAGIATLCFFVAFSSTVFRWRLLLFGFGVPARVADVFRLGFIGMVFSQVIPGGTGGDLVKGFYVVRETPDRRLEAVMSVIVDRVAGMLGLFVLGALTFAFNWEQVEGNPTLLKLFWLVAGAIVLLVGGAVLISAESLWRLEWVRRLTRRVPGRKFLSMLATAIWTLKRRPAVVVLALAISVLNHTILVVAHVFLWRAMEGVFPPIAMFFFLVPIGLLVIALPLTPGGLGVGETAFKFLFEDAGLDSGAELALLYRMVVLFWAGVGLYFYFRGKKELKEAVRAAEEDKAQLSAGEVGESP